MPTNPNPSDAQKLPNLEKQFEYKQATKSDVSIVAAILFAGETFRKGLKENEAPIVALRCVKIAKTIVDAANNQ